MSPIKAFRLLLFTVLIIAGLFVALYFNSPFTRVAGLLIIMMSWAPIPGIDNIT